MKRLAPLLFIALLTACSKPDNIDRIRIYVSGSEFVIENHSDRDITGMATFEGATDKEKFATGFVTIYPYATAALHTGYFYNIQTFDSLPQFFPDYQACFGIYKRSNLSVTYCQ